MLQRGIETPDLDVTWVSSLSWYFLTLFGLNAVYRLVLGDDGRLGLRLDPVQPGQHALPDLPARVRFDV